MAFGGLKGTLTGSNASVPNPLPVTGTVTVAVGDLIVVCTAQQTTNAFTGVTDNLGNTYTAQNAGSLSTVAGRMWYSRVTVAGSLTTINIAGTASSNDASACAAVFEGPFGSTNTIDANPANVTADLTTPYNGPATGTLATARELVIGWMACASTASHTASSGFTKQIEQILSANAASKIESQVVTATTTQTPGWTGTAPTADVLGTASFPRRDEAVGSAAGWGSGFTAIWPPEQFAGTPGGNTVPNGWVASGIDSTANTLNASTNVGGITQQYMSVVETATGGFQGFQKSITLKKGVTYQVGAWIRYPRSRTPSDVTFFGNSQQLVWAGSVSNGSIPYDTWFEAIASYTADGTETAIDFVNPGQSTGTGFDIAYPYIYQKAALSKNLVPVNWTSGKAVGQSNEVYLGYPGQVWTGTASTPGAPDGYSYAGIDNSTTSLIDPGTVNGITTKAESIRETASGGYQGIISGNNSVNWIAGHNYKLGAYIRIPTGVTASDAVFQPPSGNNQTIASAGTLNAAPKDTWIYYEISYTAIASDATGGGNVAILNPAGATGTGFDIALPTIYTKAAVGTGILSSNGSASGVGAATAQGQGILIVSAAFSAAGIGAANAGGTAIISDAVSASGIGQANGAGASINAGKASSAGIGAAAGAGTAIVSDAVSASGIGAANGRGASINATNGSAAGIGAANAQGTAIISDAVSASGIGAANGVGASINAGNASATGIGTANAQGTAIISDAVSASGIGAANGAGASINAGNASAAGVGSALGDGAAIGGGNIVSGAGAAAGTGAANGAGTQILSGNGSATATGTATGNGASIASGNGSSAGIGAATGSGTKILSGNGSAVGTGTATGAGASIAAGAGSAQGTGAANGRGASIAAGAGSAAGLGAASGASGNFAQGAGSATGTGAANAQGVTIIGSNGVAAGIGAANAQGVSFAAGAGNAPGTGLAIGGGASINASKATATGTGAANGTGTAVRDGAGSATGTGAATGSGATITAGNGSAAGTATVNGAGASIAAGKFSSVGTGFAQAFSDSGTGNGSATGTGAANAKGTAIWNVAGNAAATGQANGAGASIVAGAGSATATGTASAQATGIANGKGTAPATGAANGNGTAVRSGGGSAAGNGTATGNGTAVRTATGSATATTSVNGVGASIASAIGNAPAVGTANGVGLTPIGGAGHAAGIGSALGRPPGFNVVSGAGSASGTGGALAISQTFLQRQPTRGGGRGRGGAIEGRPSGPNERRPGQTSERRAA